MAWSNLWGNIHHQGTIYEATVPAVPHLLSLAAWTDYPDRTEAIFFLQAIAEGEGVVVWRYDADGDIVYDEQSQTRLGRELAAHIDLVATSLLGSWKTAPPDVRRALLWLLSALPQVQDRYSDLIQVELPKQFERAWSFISIGAESQEEQDEIWAFEEWAYSGSGA